MFVRPLAFITVFAMAQQLYAQIYFPLGARYAGMANSSVTLSDVWSVAHNQAGLAKLKDVSVAACHENRYLIKELGLSAASLAVPFKPGTIAVHYSYFGTSLYHESKIGLAYARTFGEKLSCGVQLNYFSKFIQNEYGQGSALAVEGGIIYEPVENVRIGFHLFNPNQTKIHEYSDERLPSIVRFGAGYRFAGNILVTAETEKWIDYKPYYKAGMEYTPGKYFAFRAGVSTNPLNLYSFGMGLVLKTLHLDLSYSYHQLLGSSPNASILFAF